MCTVSMVIDHYQKVWPEWPVPNNDYELQQLRKRVDEMEQLLKRAKIYDIENDQPDCELESKKQTLQELADEYGVEIHFPD